MIVDDIVITGDDFEITAAIKSVILKKYERLLNHYGHFITGIEVILKIANEHDNIAEANINVKDKPINAKARTDDMYKSIDEMVSKAKTQLEKYKEMHFGHGKEQCITEHFKATEEHLA